MEISEIKAQLSLAMVLHHYGLKPDKQSRLHCPFHEDKTPSMQVYYKTQTAYCFSSNCKTHGKSMDVIDFVMHQENTTKSQAINTCKAILGYQEGGKNTVLSTANFLGGMYQYFKNAVHNSKPARDYLQQRGLDHKKIEVGYNGGQFHHGTRKEEQLISQCVDVGLLLDKGIISRTGEKGYGVFGKWCIVFALKNKENAVTGFYFRSTLDKKDAKHYYLKNRKGLYPGYPDVNTKKLILTESIIDAASLLQINTITEQYSVLACYGTNGLTGEYTEAVSQLKQLEELIFFFDNDAAGRAAVHKYGSMLKSEYPSLKLTTATSIGKDINETLQGHDENIFVELLNNRTVLLFSTGDESPQPLNPTAEPKENTIGRGDSPQDFL
ncbi:CHC2 zinc finger domain-containing protein, partial [Myroides odoratus]|uniref:CHC2 zinc finger domain-containing protein n=1 Tax=Myroides odoratus TaxID=256 RepID=UPI0039B07F7D